MARQLPKNVRQIGNVNDTPKIYVEDYVDTFFSQLCEKSGEEAVGAFLIGDFQKTEEEEYVYIYGAVRMQGLKKDGIDYVIDESTWKKAYEDCKQYFEDGEMLGWFVARPGAVLTLEKSITKLHRKSFPKKNTIFVLKDSVEKDEMYYVHKFNDLLPIEGHYTYYEKNPCMQNYMISTRKKNGATPTETVEDRAAKDFRGAVRQREERMRQRRTARAMYSLSACLVLIVIIMGVSTMNRFDKSKSGQDGSDNPSNLVAQGDDGADKENVAGKDGQGEDGQAVETSGNVTTVTGNDKNGGADGGKDAGQAKDDDQGSTGQADASQGDGQGGSGGQGDDGQAGVSQEGGQVGSDGQGGEGQPGSAPGQPGDASGQENGGQAGGTGENGSNGIYIVEQGDTLALISKKMYGDISHIEEICKVNGLEDGNLIFIGQKLVLP